MLKFEKYVVGSGETEGYKALKATIPQDDVYMHYRLDGNCHKDCEDIYFVAHEDGKALCRIWMCYPRHENAISNWGAVYTLEECRGRGICNQTLDFCMKELEKLQDGPAGLFCTAGKQWLTDMYAKFGFVTAIHDTTMGPLYRPLKDSPETFKEFYENYYTPANSLKAVKATWKYRNEVDCLLKFALLDKGIDYAINGDRDLNMILMNQPERDAKVILTDTGKCVGWMLDGVAKVYTMYENMPISVEE